MCVIAMELTLVGNGNRLKFIPILIGSTYLLNNKEGAMRLIRDGRFLPMPF